jgi:predicted alpha/beta-fold hydrolase
VKASQKTDEIQSTELMSIKENAFKPLWYLKNRHLQTILPNIIHPPFPILEKERIELDDGDFIDLLWTRTHAPQTLLILHGLEGSVNSAYAKRILNYCNAKQLPAVLMNFRGCSGEPNRLLRSYHSGETGDLQQVITHLKSSGIDNIALLGYSLGGNVTLKYMGESITDPVVRCAVDVSVPLRLDICANTMDRGFAKIYQASLLRRLVKKMHLKRDLLNSDERDFPDPAMMRNFRQFDDSFTAPIHGFDSAQHYYQSCSSRQFLHRIDRPTLILQSLDDPFMTDEVLPRKDELSGSVKLELSAHGGHVGFISDNKMLPRLWLETRIHSFLNDQQFFISERNPE